MVGANHFAEISIVVDGAVDESIVIAWNDRNHQDQIRAAGTLQDIINRVKQQHFVDGLPTQVFVHDHPHVLHFEDECSCLQYETTHEPILNLPRVRRRR